MQERFSSLEQADKTKGTKREVCLGDMGFLCHGLPSGSTDRAALHQATQGSPADVADLLRWGACRNNCGNVISVQRLHPQIIPILTACLILYVAAHLLWRWLEVPL